MGGKERANDQAKDKRSGFAVAIKVVGTLDVGFKIGHCIDRAWKRVVKETMDKTNARRTCIALRGHGCALGGGPGERMRDKLAAWSAGTKAP